MSHRAIAFSCGLLTLLLSLPVRAANGDGAIDSRYGVNGRNLMGYLESFSLQTRAIAVSANDRTWMFADDANDRNALFMARVLANGQPDTTFGPGNDGRLRLALPPLVAQAYAFSVDGAFIQADGKPVVFGGVTTAAGSTGVFPGFICRFNVAGNLDASFAGSGCRMLRTFLSTTETCRVSDARQNAVGETVAIGNCAAGDLPERPFITRLASNGALDSEFGAGAALLTPLIAAANPLGQHYEALALRPDGHILVLGHFATNNGGAPDQDLGVIQFDSGGSLDTAFSGDGVVLLRYDLGGDNADFARDMSLRDDGRVVVLGQASTISPPRAAALMAQLDITGSLDFSFGNSGRIIELFAQTAGTASELRDLELDDQGRLVIAGTLTPATAVPATAGTSFWIGMLRTIAPEREPHLYISSETPTSGLVFNASLGISIPYTVVPGKLTTVTLPVSSYIETASDVIGNQGLHITAQAPVSVHGLLGRVFATDGFLALPTSALGTHYRPITWDEGIGEGNQIIVVATGNNTAVTITPLITLPGHPSGQPYNVVLQRGQTYKLSIAPPNDLSGTNISASKPIAVFSGHSCATVPDISVDFCETLVEQQTPIEQWGSEFLAVPFAGRIGGDMLRVLANQNNTEVSINGLAVANLSAGGLFETTLNSAVRITSNAPVSAAQFAKGCKADPDPCVGDPTMLSLIPTSQWQSRYSASVPNFTELYQLDYLHFMRIIAPAAAMNSILVDGNLITAGQFSAIGTTGYVSAQLATTTGYHRVASPLPISVGNVGFDAGAEAYSYPAASAPSGEGADTDELIARYTSSGILDAHFGSNGVVVLDHRSATESTLHSNDALRGIVLRPGGDVIVCSATTSAETDQSFVLSYRLFGDLIFRDGFE